ncbi:Mg2+ transporter protein CorA-like/Zinc transport protein ZntB [Penicillium malachiteum]|uniref:Mg2+ transporter protein CorA-like/Zinc transport protein ZntB n=1 Tax=Penicillium malachiteum TaxID=1324776 RepID=UPI002546F57B|nr:Mg2+ transporter protein CorA-like/Zinc transport protein ZntB [Penicillium malachiteum]KAJ5725862.1 Mg2+ transporter protein CorA-like/Zinc transport protein ZntB [Penicillium malachiteum]
MADPTQGADPPATSDTTLDQAEDQRSETEKIKQAIIDDEAEDLKKLVNENLSLLDARFDYNFDEDDPSDIIEGLSPLMFATLAGRSEIVGFLLDKGADALVKTKRPERSILELALAADDNAESMAREILDKRGKDVLEVRSGTDQWTPLLRMAYNGIGDAVKHLLDFGADTNAPDSDKDIALHLAAERGHFDIAEKLIEVDSEALKAQGNSGRTPLHSGARWGKADIVKLLLKNGATSEAQDSDGNTSMHLAAKYNHPDVVDALLANQPDGLNLIEMQNKLGETPYLTAAKFGAESSVETLLQHKASRTARDGSLNTALHLAASEGSLETAKPLVKDEPDVPNPLESRNKSQETPLLVAIQFGKKEMVDFLLESGADAGAKDADGNSAIHISAKYRQFGIIEKLLSNHESEILDSTSKAEASRTLESRNLREETPLLVAAQTGEEGLEIVHYLLERGAELEVVNQSGDNALHIAARYGSLTLATKLFEQNHAKAKLLLDVKNKSGATPLLFSAKYGRLEMVQYLLEHKASSTVRDKDENTALHLAAQSGNLEIVERFLKIPECSEILDRSNKEGKRAIEVAAQHGKIKIVNYLFIRQRTFNSEGIDLDTMFLESAKEGYIQLVRKFLREKHDLLNIEDDAGKTALVLAAQEEKFDVVDYLLAQSAKFDPNGIDLKSMFFKSAMKGYHRIVRNLLECQDDLLEQRNGDQKTALLIASEAGKADVVEFLCKKGADVEVRDLFRYTPLMNAILSESDSIPTVQCLLRYGADQAATDNGKRNALHLACYDGKTEIVSLLLLHRPDRLRLSISTADFCDDTPLCDAISQDHEPIVFRLLESENYFPQNPAEFQPLDSTEKQKMKVSSWLTRWVQPRSQERPNPKVSEEIPTSTTSMMGRTRARLVFEKKETQQGSFDQAEAPRSPRS